ncbi:MAG: hypothetical protein N2512_07660 [Armatimonadetes bacterium]|nr:hypothetical protein [Armatimonadota bacterium]
MALTGLGCLRSGLIALFLAFWPFWAWGQVAPASVNVRDYGAKGDGVSDDTQAILEAFAAAEKLRISEQPVPGQAYVFSAGNVFFPNGKYRLSAPITPTANMLGEDNAILYQPDPSTDIISWDSAWRWQISGFTFLGGRHHLNIGNANLDTGRIIIDRCVFQNASGAAVFIREGTASTQLTVTNCVFNYCDQVLVNWCDMARVADSWVTTSPTMQNRAVFENHGILLLEHVLGVPLVDPERDQRWIDNYNGVTCRNVRFGGEGAGFTAIVNWATYDADYPVWPTFVILEACQVYCLGNPRRRAAIFCEEIPNQIIVRDCNGFPDLPVLLVSERLDLDTYFDRAAERGEGCLRFYIGPEQVELRLRDLPEQMRPYQVGEVCADGPPTRGRWQRGAFVRNRNLEGPWTSQGSVKYRRPAETEPFGWYCVESGQPGVWRPVHFSFAPLLP